MALLISFVSLIFARQALWEQRRIRQAGTDPVVLAHLGQREDAREMVTFELTNVGAGAARNVSIEVLDPDIIAGNMERLVVNITQLDHPIRVIPQDRSVSYNFGLGFSLLADPTLPPFRVRVRYEDIDDQEYDSTQLIDVKELQKQRADRPVASNILGELKNISTGIGKINRSLSPLAVRPPDSPAASVESRRDDTL
jgi:hypothetical protein